MTPRSRQLSALLIVFAVALTGCTDDGEKDADPQPTTTQPSTTTTESPEAADEEALRQLAEDWFAAVRAVYIDGADPDALAEFAVDPYLAGVLEQVATFQASGNEARAGDQTRHEVVTLEISESDAVLVECVIDADEILSAEGEVLNDQVQANLYETNAALDDGSWRLTERRTLNEVDGSDQCPAE